MTDFIRGLLVMYAVSGGVSALIYLVMLRHAPQPTILDAFKVLFIAVTGPVCGWLMLWGSIDEQISRSRRSKQIRKQIGSLMEDIERAVKEEQAKSKSNFAPANPRFDRHMWN